MVNTAKSWPMWAYSRRGTYEYLGKKWWVELHDLPDPVVPVTVTEVPEDSPDGTHWGWRDAGGSPPEMIWGHRGVFEAQFPYGSRAEVEAGRGRVVRLRITPRSRRTPGPEEEGR